MQAKIQIDYLVTGGTVVTMDARRSVYDNGAVAIKGSRIEAVGQVEDLFERFEAQSIINASGRVVLPGLINVHSHLAMTLFRGLIDDVSLESWLSQIWKLEAQFATSQNVRLGTQLAVAEMIRCGTTCSTDMYWQLRHNCDVAEAAGFRLVNGPTFTDIVGPDGEMPENHLPNAVDFIQQYTGNEFIIPCVQVHSTYTTSVQMLENARDLVEQYQLVFITHANESRAEVAGALASLGHTPVAYLRQIGLLGPHTLLAHCVHLTDEEIEALAAAGTSVAHCPQSNLKLGNGIARVPELLQRGVNVALGTDGAATNNDLDIFDEMRTAALIHKGNVFDPTVLPAEQVLEMATVRAAHAFGLDDRLGSLEAGKLADLVILDLGSPHLTPIYSLYSHLVYAARGGDVCSVMIHGRWVMRERELLTLDEAAIRSQVARLSRDIWTSYHQPG